MRIASVRIENYRCLDDVELEFDDVTVLVGANGSGKSSVLHALKWFFDGGSLETEDLGGQDPTGRVTVGVTFTDLSDADRGAFGNYVIEDTVRVWRTWSHDEGEKLTGRGLAFPPFEAIRAQTGAQDKIRTYTNLRETMPDLELPTARSATAVLDAMTAWEQGHPEAVQESTVSATHLFGFAGQGRLGGRFDFVVIPAVSDPATETQDGRGTLLRQLVDREGGQSEAMQQRLEDAEQELAATIAQIIEDEGGESLSVVANAVTAELSQFVPDGTVRIEPRPPDVRIPQIGFSMRVTDGGVETDVRRQGHGFQRALLISLVRQLARVDQRGDPPGLFLALEEPELYQHPARARHVARTLAELPRTGAGAIQVAYATHSEHFVDPSHYERLRRFRKRTGRRAWPTAEVTRAAVTRVAERLAGTIDADQIALRIQITLRRQLAEAVFARAVLLVEGRSDAAFLLGLADRVGGFDAAGISVVAGMGKPQLLLPWTILDELGVPAYVVFDGDAGLDERMRKKGKTEPDIKRAVADTQETNRLILHTLGAQPEAEPQSAVTHSYTVLEDELETEFQRWPSFVAMLEELRNHGVGEWREKSEDLYRQAAAEAHEDPPPLFVDLLQRVLDRP